MTATEILGEFMIASTGRERLRRFFEHAVNLTEHSYLDGHRRIIGKRDRFVAYSRRFSALLGPQQKQVQLSEIRPGGSVFPSIQVNGKCIRNLPSGSFGIPDCGYCIGTVVVPLGSYSGVEQENRSTIPVYNPYDEDAFILEMLDDIDCRIIFAGKISRLLAGLVCLSPEMWQRHRCRDKRASGGDVAGKCAEPVANAILFPGNTPREFLQDGGGNEVGEESTQNRPQGETNPYRVFVLFFHVAVHSTGAALRNRRRMGCGL